MSATALRDPQLSRCGVAHGFGVRDTPAPEGLLRPRQVHGCGVVEAAECRRRAPEADAVVSAQPGAWIGIVTADCVPILLASRDGRAVAAVHAGWRGLARGVVAAAVGALRRTSGAGVRELVAAIGPHIGACCYEVDAPVLAALGGGPAGPLEGALAPARPGHAFLDLASVARKLLLREGIPGDAIGEQAAHCTACDPLRFHSYRRDGARAGRLVHVIAASGSGGLDTRGPRP